MIALPHLGASTREAEDNCAAMVAEQLRDFLEHGNIRNAVNFPQVDMARESPWRARLASESWFSGAYNVFHKHGARQLKTYYEELNWT